jgi:hypothetical protein
MKSERYPEAPVMVLRRVGEDGVICEGCPYSLSSVICPANDPRVRPDLQANYSGGAHLKEYRVRGRTVSVCAVAPLHFHPERITRAHRIAVASGLVETIAYEELVPDEH